MGQKDLRDAPTLRCGDAVATLLRALAPQPRRRALRVAVTGGIGCGKSLAAAAFAQLGAVIADADAIARDVVAPGTPALTQIVEAFGAQVLRESGELNRAALARTVFSDETARRQLDAITHPRIAEQAEQVLAQAPAGGLAVYDVPLLVEAVLDKAGESASPEDAPEESTLEEGTPGETTVGEDAPGDRTSTQSSPQFDAIIVVTAELEVRLKRLEQRGLVREDARARIASQASDTDRLDRATIHVENTGSEADLRCLIEEIDRRWLRPALEVQGSAQEVTVAP